MTTNSPNPVGGDVQALIRNIQRRIKNTKRWLSANKSIGNPENEAVELILIYETALAALTAEPVVEVNTWWPLGVDGGEQPFLQPLGNLPEKGSKLYTAPPAQILRPVELPQGRVMQVAFETDPVNADMYLSISRDAAARAIREAGGEVKS